MNRAFRPITNILSDFDNVAYAHTENCQPRELHCATLIACHYFGLSYEDARQRVGDAWQHHRNGFAFDRKGLPNEHISDAELYRQLARLTENDKNGVADSRTIKLVNELSAEGSFAFYSHSSLLSLQFMGARLGLSPTLLHHGSTGLDTAGPEGGLRKDNGVEGYLWVCEKEGFNPSQTVMLEDTHRNLYWAKEAGLETIHIHWGKPVEEKYIDYSFKTTNDALTFLQQSMALPAQKIA